jgi:hypothetical protein
MLGSVVQVHLSPPDILVKSTAYHLSGKPFVFYSSLNFDYSCMKRAGVAAKVQRRHRSNAAKFQHFQQMLTYSSETLEPFILIDM